MLARPSAATGVLLASHCHCPGGWHCVLGLAPRVRNETKRKNGVEEQLYEEEVRLLRTQQVEHHLHMLGGFADPEASNSQQPLGLLWLWRLKSLQREGFEVSVFALVRGICYETHRPGRSRSPQRQHDMVIARGVVCDVTGSKLCLRLREPRRRWKLPELRQLDKSVIRHVRFGPWNFSETYVGVTSVVPRDGSRRRSIQNWVFIKHHLNQYIRKPMRTELRRSFRLKCPC